MMKGSGPTAKKNFTDSGRVGCKVGVGGTHLDSDKYVRNLGFQLRFLSLISSQKGKNV